MVMSNSSMYCHECYRKNAVIEQLRQQNEYYVQMLTNKEQVSIPRIIVTTEKHYEDLLIKTRNGGII